MKSESQIRKRLNNLLYRSYQKRAKKLLKVCPQNCVFNHPSSIEYDDGSPFRICGLAMDEGDFVECNSIEKAENCRSFVFSRDKKSIREEVEAEVSSEDGVLQYPEIRILKWVLEDDALVVPVSEDPAVPWWRRILTWFRR